ncbi:hypothetical protein H9P43_006129 [Blastocladiella emersonii ATCC 22665]|nr:hypothetical protein H9P43_006129 [Blastocladiella emersonii ATCC 22665]
MGSNLAQHDALDDLDRRLDALRPSATSPFAPLPLPHDVLEVVARHLCHAATVPYHDPDDTRNDGSAELVTLLALGRTCRDLHAAVNRLLWRATDWDVTSVSQFGGHSDAPTPEDPTSVPIWNDGGTVQCTAVWPCEASRDLIVRHHGPCVFGYVRERGANGSVTRRPAMGAERSLDIPQLSRLSLTIYSDRFTPSTEAQIVHSLVTASWMPPLRRLNLHGASLSNTSLTRILGTLAGSLRVFTLSSHGRVRGLKPEDLVYDLSGVTLPHLQKLYFEAWLSLDGGGGAESGEEATSHLVALPVMPKARALSIKCTRVSTFVFVALTTPRPHGAPDRVFFWVRSWIDDLPDQPSTASPSAAAGHCPTSLAVMIESQFLPLHALPRPDLIQSLDINGFQTDWFRPPRSAILDICRMTHLRRLRIGSIVALDWTTLTAAAPAMRSLEVLDLDRINVDGVPAPDADGEAIELGRLHELKAAWPVARALSCPELRVVTVYGVPATAFAHGTHGVAAWAWSALEALHVEFESDAAPTPHADLFTLPCLRQLAVEWVPLAAPAGMWDASLASLPPAFSSELTHLRVPLAWLPPLARVAFPAVIRATLGCPPVPSPLLHDPPTPAAARVPENLAAFPRAVRVVVADLSARAKGETRVGVPLAVLAHVAHTSPKLLHVCMAPAVVHFHFFNEH